MNCILIPVDYHLYLLCFFGVGAVLYLFAPKWIKNLMGGWLLIAYCVIMIGAILFAMTQGVYLPTNTPPPPECVNTIIVP